MNWGKAGLITAGIAAGVPAAAVAICATRALVNGPDPVGAPEAPDGVHADLRSHLWSPLRFGIMEASLAGNWIARHVRGNGSAPGGAATTPLQQAEASWAALERSNGVRGEDGFFAPASWTTMYTASVWPVGQALNAALDIASQTGDYHYVNDITRSLSMYEKEGAYNPNVWGTGHHRYYDDNAWIALDLLQAWRQTGDTSYLDRVKGMMPFMLQGIRDDGGVWWQENNPRMTVNTCSMAPTEEVLLGLYEATGEQRWLDLGLKVDGFLNSTLREPGGLYADHMDTEGKVDHALYSYNQGTPIGASVQLYRITGDRAYLERAQQTADAALAWAREDDHLWKDSPAFNAIFFRNLMQLDAVAPDPRYRQLLDEYLTRAWNTARNPGTGLFDRGGIGRYREASGMSTLDQAGMVEMFGLQSELDAGQRSVPLPGTHARAR